MKVETAKKHITEAIKKNGKFTHNVISTTLRSVADEYGNAEANKLVDEFQLESKFGIGKVNG